MLRLRSDEQLVALFRAGHDEAFRIIHDRYRQRLFAYTRQMIPGSRQDAEDALQDVFIKAYAGLRANDRELALRAWLYRVAHNRCIDELRRPPPPSPEVIDLVRSPIQDPIAQAEQRESLRRLISDVRRLPDQQRSALLMRELSGMSYTDLSGALGASIPAVKSLLVRARIGLARAQEARDTACSEIRDDLLLAHDRRVRPSAIARRHLRDCAGCREFRSQARGVSRELGALVPAVGPMAALAKLLGIGGGASGGAAAGSGAAGGAACAGGAASTGGILTAGGVLAGGAGHVATLFAAAVVTAGGAAEIQHTIAVLAAPQSRIQQVAVSGSDQGGAVRSLPGVSPNRSDAASSASTVPTASAAAAPVAPSAPRRPRTAAAKTSAPAASTSPAVTLNTGPAGPGSPSVTAGVDAANAGSSSSTATGATGQSAGSIPGASSTGSATHAPGSGSAPGATAGPPAAGIATGAPVSPGSADSGAPGTSSPAAVAGPASGATGTSGANASPPPIS